MHWPIRMKKLALSIIILGLSGWVYLQSTNGKPSESDRNISAETVADTTMFLLKKGDILVRPNWSWLPGSYPIANGRKYGHVAIVTQEASGKTIDEALEKAKVIEALFFDQATRSFQFQKKDQIRETKASISFGRKFTGIRYLLHASITPNQIATMINFLRNQLDGGYDILSLKHRAEASTSNEATLSAIKNQNWHCATLVWEAYFLSTGIDLDANQGLLIYPSDIIACKQFDLPGGRIRF